MRRGAAGEEDADRGHGSVILLELAAARIRECCVAPSAGTVEDRAVQQELFGDQRGAGQGGPVERCLAGGVQEIRGDNSQEVEGSH